MKPARQRCYRAPTPRLLACTTIVASLVYAPTAFAEDSQMKMPAVPRAARPGSI
jgi:hypothetical protein